jgi:hypothetical protein
MPPRRSPSMRGLPVADSEWWCGTDLPVLGVHAGSAVSLPKRTTLPWRRACGRQPRAHRLPALRPGIRTRPAATVPGLRHPGWDGSPPARGRLLVGSRCSPAVVFEVEPLAWAVVDPCGQTLDGEGTGAGGPRAAGWVAARASAASIPASGSPGDLHLQRVRHRTSRSEVAPIPESRERARGLGRAAGMRRIGWQPGYEVPLHDLVTRG